MWNAELGMGNGRGISRGYKHVAGLPQRLNASPAVSDWVAGLQDSRHYHSALCSCGKNLSEVFQFDSSNAKYRDGYPAVHFGNIPQSDRPVVRLCWRGKKRSETDVIGTLGIDGLFETVGRKSDDRIGSDHGADIRDRHIVLTDVHAIGPGFGDKLRMIVEKERDPGFAAQRGDLQGDGKEGFQILRFRAEL